MILCALRPSEALGARWAEIDFVRRVWIIPAARTKRSREHVVPLVPRRSRSCKSWPRAVRAT